jgi:hypothetical protein
MTTRDCPKQCMLRVMALEAQMLTTEEFASLLTVGNAPGNSSALTIPAAHSARLIVAGLHGGPRGQAAYDHARTNPDICRATRWLMALPFMSGSAIRATIATRSCVMRCLAAGFSFVARPSLDQVSAQQVGLQAWPSRRRCCLQMCEGRIGDAA